MSEYLKKAIKTPESDDSETQKIVERILKDVRVNGEDAYLSHYGAKFENWSGKLILTKEEIDEIGSTIPDQIKEDLNHGADLLFRGPTISDQ